MKTSWKRALSILLAISMIVSLLSSIAVMGADASTTTTFPEYYTKYEEVPGDGKLIGTDYIELGLKMTDEEIDTKIEALLNTMTDAEKATYLGGGGTGTVYGNAGDLPGTARLGVPEVRMHDGPSGVLSLWPTTNTPNRQMAAATWDEDLIERYGEVYGSEGKAIGENFQLGSQFDITRTAEFGRAKDQMGEDPYLLSKLAAAETKGMQSNGVIAVGKHYAAFAQDASPAGKKDIIVSEQALHEIYLPGFEGAVKAGMLGLMSSYNAVNGTMASSHTYLQLDVLRELWGYKGFTITDWGGNDGFTLTKGTDIEMPSLSSNSLANAEKNIPDEAERTAAINTAVGHVLYALGHTGYLYLVETYTDANGVLKAKEEPGRTERIKLYADSDTAVLALQEENNQIVQEVAEGGGVLLENKDKTLPLNKGEKVAMIGVGAKYTQSGTGGERSYGVGYMMDSPYDTLKGILGEDKVFLSPVYDNGGSVIPAENLYYKAADGSFKQGFILEHGDKSETVTGKTIEYLPAEKSFEGGTSIACNGDKNDTDGNTYKWTAYVKAPADGEYSIVMQGIGGTVKASVSKLDSEAEDAPEAELQDDGPFGPGGPGGGWPGGGGNQEPADPNKASSSVSYASSQGAQWHSGNHCTDTGMSIGSKATVSMEAGKYYKVEITGVANRTEKNLQLRLAWLTPETSASYDSATKTISGGEYDNAIKLAKECDKSVVFVTATAGNKPSTRNPDNLNISADQEQLILDVAKAAHEAGHKVIVVICNETAVTIQNWVDSADAILMMYHSGQRGGVATANLLSGVVNPSGKLAYVMPKEGNQTVVTYSEEQFNRQEMAAAGANLTLDDLRALNDGELQRIFDSVSSTLQMRYRLSFNNLDEFRAALDGENANTILNAIVSKYRSASDSYYDEGIYTSYRLYDALGVEQPRYDFGYGLSYTTFAYSDMTVEEKAEDGELLGYDVTFKVTNTGDVAGREVAQLYVGEAKNLPEGIQSAPVQLAGFHKTALLEPGKSETVTIHVSQRSLSYWNQNLENVLDKWTIAEGKRTIYVGAASDNLILSKEVEIADPTKTTFPEYYTQYEEVPRSGNMIGTDYIALGLKMTDEEIDEKIEALLNTMTDEEKATYLGGGGTGTVYGNAGDLPGTARLGVPEVRMHDGPSGVLSLWPTTNTPNRQMAAATWDEDLIERYGEVYGSEGKAIGENFQLGSQFDITRTAEFGRAKDQMGEDPYLLSKLAAAETKGMQSNGVIAVGKHYAAFAQDASPAGKKDIIVSEQALHEIYLPGFEGAVKAGMLGLMSSYNAVNGTMASSHTYLQLDVLRELWGYKGFTITDWGGNDGFTLTKGTDIEMPSLSSNSLANAEKNIPDEAERTAAINTAVGHVLYALGHTGYLYLVETYTDANGVLKAKEEPGRTERIKLYADSDTAVLALQEENNQIVQEVAEGGGVLLENKDKTLPLNKGEKVAMIGVGAKYTQSGTGGERSYGVGYMMDSPYDTLKGILGEDKVFLSPVYDNGGSVIPAENLYYKAADGSFKQGFILEHGDKSETVTGKTIEYLPAEKSFEGGTSIACNGDKNDTDGNTYKWTAYVKAPADGEYSIVMQGIGGTVKASVSKLDSEAEDAPEAELQDDGPFGPGGPGGGWPGGGGNQEPADPNKASSSVSYASSQGAQWHSGNHCTDTGMSIGSKATVSMEAGKYYKVEITGVANRTEKNLQLRLAWLTPETSASYDSATKTISGGEYDNAIKLAKECDKSVVFVTATAGNKPSTRNPDNLNISADQEQLILDVAKAAHEAGHKVIVVICNETAVTIQNWVDSADAILMMYHSGQRGGVATANLLSGVVNPSGKLAYVMPKEGNQTVVTYSEEQFNRQEMAAAGANLTLDDLRALNDGELQRIFDSVSSTLQMRYRLSFNNLDEFRAALDGENANTILNAIVSKYRSASDSYYDEGIYTSYRLYDALGVEQPRYDFGYGLSYTTFAYSDMTVEEKAEDGELLGYDVTFKVTNTGDVAGREVAQLYVGEAKNLPEGIQSAPVQLAGFHKTDLLQPGQSETVTIHVDQRALSYWNQNLDVLDKWTIAEGKRTISVGAASDNLILTKEVDVKKTQTEFRFDDVKDPAQYYFAPVYWAYRSDPQITNGTSATLFSPEKSCTRAQVVTFLWRAAGEPAPKSSENPFKDVKAGQYYYKAVLWAVEKGITNGTTATTFDPEKTCTRAQIVTFLWRYAGEPAPKSGSNPFNDVKDSAYYFNAVLWAAENDITNGTTKTTFDPEKTCTRAQVVTFLYRALA